tara:strand:- start:271 stop:1884 length:1614 start_codon:yes stop_codon:yes gene_type:complete
LKSEIIKNNHKFDAIIVGAGFGGIYMLYSLNKLGLNAIILEQGKGVGGTWYWNRYPGARCDIPSIEYSYSFSDELQQEWQWSHKYSTQPEILEYANHVTDRFDLRDKIKFNEKVTSANYANDSNVWKLETNNGNIYESKYCVMATGTLSSINKPKFEGIDVYKGDWYITGNWPHENIDLSDKHVGIIGTGSSAVQAIPVIAESAKTLTVFQRTANYSVPANNHPLDPKEINEFKKNYSTFRAQQRQTKSGVALTNIGTQSALDVSDEERLNEYQKRWEAGYIGFISPYVDISTNEVANETLSEFVRSKIREIVKDSKTAELLSPKNAIGCKRLCADTNYFETYNRENVKLIDVNKTPILSLTENGVKTSEEIYDFDVVVFALGFDAMTGALLSIDITGKNGEKLSDKWSEGPRSYLGLSIQGFPNMFTITGPGSPSVLGNMMVAIEQHVEWITTCIKEMESKNKTEIEADIEAENNWMEHIEEVAGNTLRYSCNSWYVGANIPGKKRVFMPYIGGYDVYRKKCDEVLQNGYEGFTFG